MKQLFNRPALDEAMMRNLRETIKGHGGHVFVEQPGEIWLWKLTMQPRICFTMPKEQALPLYRAWFDLNNSADNFRWSMEGYFPTIEPTRRPEGWREIDGAYLLLGHAHGLVEPAMVRSKTMKLLIAMDLASYPPPTSYDKDSERGND